MTSEHPDGWFDNIQRLRAKIASQLQERKLQADQPLGEHQWRQSPYVSYNPLIPNDLPIKSEPEELSTLPGVPGSRCRSSLLLPTPVTPMFLAPPTKASWIDLGPGRKADPGVGGGSHVYTCEARDYLETSPYEGEGYFGDQASPAKRGRPRKHAPKVPLPPLYVFIR